MKNGNFHLYSKHQFLSFVGDNLCICMYLNLLITFNDHPDASWGTWTVCVLTGDKQQHCTILNLSVLYFFMNSAYR